MLRFERDFALTTATRVLDVGGNTGNWRFVSVRPLLTFVNINTLFVGPELASSDRVVVADGCDLPFEANSYDVVFCNSVIEHLGSPAKQMRMAQEIARVGRSYFVQTPNFWFPIEPHYLAPGLQFLPDALRGFAGRWLTPWGWLEHPSPARARAFADEIRLLTYKEMRALFPAGHVMAERLGGVSKSWIAVSR